MKLPSTIALLLLSFCSTVQGADYVVELECFVFDSALSKQQMQQIYDAAKDCPAAEKSSFVTAAELKALREQSQLIHESMITLLLSSGDIASHTQVSSDFVTAVRLQLAKETKGACQIQIKWGVLMKINERQSLELRLTEPREFILGKKVGLVSSATNGGFMMFVAGIREAGPKDREIEIPDDLEKTLRERHVKLP